MDRVHSAIPLKELSGVLSGWGARQVANKNVHTKVLLESVLSRSPEYASSTQKPYRGETAKDHWGGASLRGKVAMGTASRPRHEDKGPLHHSRTEGLRPFGTGMAEPLRTPIFHIADILGWSATIATPGPQRNIRRAGVGPEQDRYAPGSWMGIDLARLPPREGKTTPGFLW